MTIEIANKLVELRKNSGLSQEELAEKLGLSRQAISKWERAESSPDTDNLIALAKLYNISLDELLLNKETSSELNETKELEETDERNSSIKINFVWEFGKIVPIIAIVVYLLLGLLWGLWHPGWIVFLCIPVIESLIDAIKNKDIEDFEYTVFVLVMYFTFSHIYDLYGTLWILFLSIPIYEWVVKLIKRK